MEKLKVVSLIPARGNSKSILKKNLYPLNGIPLIDFTLKASTMSIVDETWVSTDDIEIAEHCENFEYFDAPVNVLMRPDYLATDDATTESVMKHFTENVEYDIIVLIQATSPMITHRDINNGLEILLVYNYDSVFSVAEASDMLIWDKETKKPLNYDPFDRGNRQSRNNNIVIETGGFYITHRRQFIETECRMSGSIGFVKIPFWKMFEVDDIEDAKMIEKLMK